MKTKRTVRNCLAVFQRLCPLEWEELKSTENVGVRHCDKCEREVFFCASDEETIAPAKAGHCVARELPAIYLGQPRSVPPPTHRQQEALHWKGRERAIDSALKDINYSTRNCRQCKFPVANWRKTCLVCGFDIGRNISADS